MPIIDVTEETFEQEVIERSRTVPVVVDFWAEWCGPCRQLTPALEAAARKREDEVVLAKLNTDENPQLAARFQIQGIPAVKAFKDGEVVSEFVGAQPPANVERFFDALAPSEADRLVEAGDEESLRRALELQPGREDAAVPLARMLLARGERDEALRTVENVAGSFQADGLRARMRLEDAGDPEVSEALAALDAGDRERAVDLLIDALEHADSEKKDAIRQLVVAILDELGVEHPHARDARRRLAAALY
jgi:putative thioredoxin